MAASEFHITARSMVAPGDIRALGRGVEVVLYRDVRSRPDWSALLSALAIAIGRGASVRWLP